MDTFLSPESELKLPALFCVEKLEENEKYKVLVGLKQIKQNFSEPFPACDNASHAIEKVLIDLKSRTAMWTWRLSYCERLGEEKISRMVRGSASATFGDVKKGLIKRADVSLVL